MDASEPQLTVLDQIASSDKVRRKIIDVASMLYARKGYTATSIQEISETAGVSLPVTYHYVKRKSEIMRMIMEDVLKVFQDSLLQQIGGIDDTEKKLANAIMLLFRVVDRQRDKVLLIYQKSSSLDKASKSSVMRLEVEMAEVIGKIIAEGIEEGIFKAVDVDLMSYNILMLACTWVLKQWHFKKRLTLDQYIDLQLMTIMDALKK